MAHVLIGAVLQVVDKKQQGPEQELFMKPMRPTFCWALNVSIELSWEFQKQPEALTAYPLYNQNLILLTQERERRSPPFNHLRMHPFSEGVSALQIYCMKEGVKVRGGEL